MNKQLVIFYIKRHAAALVGLVLAIGFGVFGYMKMGEWKGTIDEAENSYKGEMDSRANLEKGQAMGGSQGVKVSEANVDEANKEAEIHQEFIKKAAEVIQQIKVDPMSSPQFKTYMDSVIVEMNQRAVESFVEIQRDPTNTSDRIRYNFTFMNLRPVPQLARDQIPELQMQLRDIRTIAGVLFRSRVHSIESLQRTRVTSEDKSAGLSRDFLDTRKRYTNNVTVVRPYKVRFRCLSGGIARALNGFASERDFVVIRKVEVTQLGAEAPNAGGGAGGMPGMGGIPGMGGSPSAGGSPGSEGGEPGGLPGGGIGGAPMVKPKKSLTPLQMAWLVKQGFATTKANNVISESTLEVDLDLDVIRKKPKEFDPNENTEPVPPTPQPESPPATTTDPSASTNAVSSNPSTNASPAP
jgi:hypothetical protein|tara:strand:- start:227 stop:1456 length:1230 start_codon:yes stop_codon:yes gene_type:complete